MKNLERAAQTGGVADVAESWPPWSPEGRALIDEFSSAGGVTVRRERFILDVDGALDEITDALDERLGMVASCDSEYPGRYFRKAVGFVDPPLQISARGKTVTLTALNERGTFFLGVFAPALCLGEEITDVRRTDAELVVTTRVAAAGFPEEERTRQTSAFSVLRRLVRELSSPADEYLGLYGAFGYDLGFQFEPARLRSTRPDDQRDLLLYLPDELVVVDHRAGVAERRRYEFLSATATTQGLARNGTRTPYAGDCSAEQRSLPAGAYADLTRQAKKAFARGDLFEVVLSQTFYQGVQSRPSELFRWLRAENPSPYGFLVNLGNQEYLVGASPEMYVRVSGRRVETCPVSGTVARGKDAMTDAEQIMELLNSAKDESELTMCTDVDRNDKARICEPGSIRVIGRRQIELHSRLIHTADHVVGVMREGYDGLDALLAHAWAVTVTGAPKAWAMQFIEDHEPTVRGWYGGTVGMIGFNGNVDTGLTIRTIRVKSGVAEVRVGATLLFDSVPEHEEEETELKASALLMALRRGQGRPGCLEPPPRLATRHAHRAGRRLLILDHQDSFVHMLAACFRQAGADVRTLRAPVADGVLAAERPELIVLSPGPGQPADFNTSATLAAALRLGLPVFGVCLGLQAIVEFFGGKLGMLSEPVHGKASVVNVSGGRLLAGLPRRFTAGRYHSLYAAEVPDCLEVTASAEDGVVMAVEHRELPIAAVQFHPESILSMRDAIGSLVIAAVLRELGPR
jgi:anthranilate synthase